jgi:hypothetical protein
VHLDSIIIKFKNNQVIAEVKLLLSLAESPLWDAALVTSFSWGSFVLSILLGFGIGIEEQGVATWFIGPRTINMTSCTK